MIREKTLLTLCQKKELSKFKRALLLPQNQGLFLLLQIKVRIFLRVPFDSIQDWANSPWYQFKYIQLGDIKAKLEIKLHSSSDCKFYWRSNQRSLLYFFIVKSHTEIVSTYIQININWSFVTLFCDCWFIFYKICVYTHISQFNIGSPNIAALRSPDHY